MSGITNDYERRAHRDSRLSMADDKRIRGYAVVFNSLSQDLGGFREVIKPEAVNRAVNGGADIRALVNHDTGQVIGRTLAGTLSLYKDSQGLRVEIYPPNTTAGRDIVELVSRGDVSGMSFGFRVIEDDWHMEDGEAVRDVMDMEISEVSVVAFPAYLATSVDVAQRSLQQFKDSQRGSKIEWLKKRHRTLLAK